MVQFKILFWINTSHLKLCNEHSPVTKRASSSLVILGQPKEKHYYGAISDLNDQMWNIAEALSKALELPDVCS